MKRRSFLKSTALQTVALSTLGLAACSNRVPKNVTSKRNPLFQLSLGQWSLHKQILAGTHDPLDFAQKSKSMGFKGLEYVSQLYKSHYETSDNVSGALATLGKELNARAAKHKMENLLIMIEKEGDLASSNAKARKEGVENHHKWVDLAHSMKCHSIGINLFGSGSMIEQEDAAAESMAALGDYAKDFGINVIVENHGGYSSDPNWVVRVLKKVNRPNCGTLPDFGNFCLLRENGERWGTPCMKEYPDVYEAVEKMMPFAQAVSAKSYDFDVKGNETKINYKKMLKVVKESGYRGYVGVEYEGEEEEEIGISKTRDLILSVLDSL